MTLSYSALELYEECPLLYRLIYIDKRKRMPRSYFSFGNTIHRTLRDFYTDVLFGPPSLDELLSYYRRNWIDQGYSDDEERRRYFRIGLYILGQFYQKEKAEKRKPVAVEYRFRIRLKNCQLSGYIDRIDRLNGGVEIIDYKTSPEPPAAEDLKTNRQLAIYQLGAERNLNLKADRLTIYHLRSLLKISIPAHDQAFLDEVVDRIEELAARIEREEFNPRLRESCPCEFGHLCPYFREEKPEIGTVVDEYGQISEKIREDQKRKVNLAHTIIQYLDDNRLEQAFGEKYSVFRRQIVERSLKRAVREVLDQEDLWQQAARWLEDQGYKVEVTPRQRSRLYSRRRDV
ncbi:hypothetical protein DRP53_10020 [candidate division WOR-3 bacterium]|uniref:PD-(D/E)XK endonuclease-like domain-containing protein n=1 Tax=candidate division WOR-3 bacterium TaxID=2052148 RepID=A0A660SEY2_UNCW3|nr:MAG: hypothetical protein DRP53_10020 [candidate division WOR-3 bacterium]